MLIKNGSKTMLIRCIITELLQCKVHKNADISTFSGVGDAIVSFQDASDHHGPLTIFHQRLMR